MTKKQYACIESAKEIIAKIQELAYYGDIDGDGQYARDKCYEIDMLCRGWLDDFKDTDPNFYNKEKYIDWCKHGGKSRRK